MQEDWAALAASWDLALEVGGYPAATRRSYRKALESVTAILAATTAGPTGDISDDDLDQALRDSRTGSGRLHPG